MSLADENPDALLADGFEEAFLGICRQFSRPALAAYDRGRCIEILVARDGMTREEAEEHFEFNVQGAWMGENTPVFVEVGKALEDDGVLG